MPMTSTDIREMKRHIALNNFYIEHPIGSVMELSPNICVCQSWIVDKKKCSCEKTYIHLDYSETTNMIFPTTLPVGNM
jgi:hypothetical protein